MSTGIRDRLSERGDPWGLEVEMIDDEETVEVTVGEEVENDEVVDQNNQTQRPVQVWVEEEKGVNDGSALHHQNWTLRALMRAPMSFHYY